MKYPVALTMLILVFLLTATKITSATEQEKYTGRTYYINSTKEFFLVEGIAVAYSFLASNNPKDFGVALAWLTPLMLASGKSGDESTTNATIAMFVGMETMAFYNMWVLDKNKDMPEENFRQNFVGWNVVFAAAAATEYLSRRSKSKSRYTYFVAPIEGGGFVQLSYQF
jgi:hypothetical protein